MRDIDEIRKDFPVLNTLIDGKPVIYLDSTATSLKPKCVIEAMDDYYCKLNTLSILRYI